MSIIPNFINPDRLNCSVSREQAREQLGVSQSSFLIGTIGTLEERKGFQYLAQAVTQLRQTGENVQLLSVGPQENSYAKTIRQFIDEQSMTEHIKLLGRRTDIPEILRAMDCACLPSLREVMPISLLEAMGAGVPALATRGKVQRLGIQAQQSMRERFAPTVLVPRIVEVYQRFMPK